MNCNKNGIKKEGESCSLNNNCIYPNCMKELEQEAENLYPINSTGSMFMANREQINNLYKQEGFIAGATSKYVEKQKLEFAIEQLKKFRECTFGRGVDVIKELEQKLLELCYKNKQFI